MPNLILPALLAVAARLPWWAWGGLFGATLITLLVTGQTLAPMAFGHYGWLALAERPADVPCLIGVALLFGGVVLIRR